MKTPKENDEPVGLRVDYGYGLLRRWLYKHGYVLVHRDRYRQINKAWHQKSENEMAEHRAWREIWEYRDRIKELEAEIEAHRRVEAVLAERALRHENSD